MTNKKNTITRATALAYAIEHIDNPEVVEVLTKMHAQVTKPRAKSNTPSKAHIANVALAKAAVEAISAKGEPVTTKWICEHVNGIMTPQKCTAVMRIAVDNGEVVRNKDEKVVTYTVE